MVKAGQVFLAPCRLVLFYGKATAIPQYFCTQLDVQYRLSANGVALRLDDDGAAFQQSQQEATNEVMEYCIPLYAFNDLYTNATTGGWVNDRATDLATYYLAGRRGNTQSKALAEKKKDCLAKLEAIQQDDRQIPLLTPRHMSSPTFSNINVNPWYDFKKIRVERPLSEQSTPSGYAQVVDWQAELSVEFILFVGSGLMAFALSTLCALCA